MKKLLASLALLASLVVGAQAQTGSVKTPGALTTETNILWSDNTTGLITPFNARQTLLDMVSSYLPLGGGTLTGSLVIGVGPADASLTINANTAATLAPTAGTLIHTVGADGVLAIHTLDSFTQPGIIIGRRADGTLASKAAVAAAANVIAMQGWAWNGSAYNFVGDIRVVTQNLQSVSDFSSAIVFRNTPVGTTAFQEAMRITSAAGVPVAIGINTAVPDALLTINANIGASVAPIAGTNLHIVGADATTNRITMHSYGTISVLGQYHSQGTQASKSATASGNLMFAFGANGWNGSAYVASTEIDFLAGETFSGTASGGSIRFQTTPLTTTGVAEAMRIQPSGGVSIGPTAALTDPGLGTLLVQSAIKIDNTLVSDTLSVVDVSKNWTSGAITNVMANLTSYNSSARLVLRNAGGTEASPTTSFGLLGSIQFRGWYTVGGPAFTSNAIAFIGGNTITTLTSADWGSFLSFNTTPAGTITTAEAMRVQGSGGVSIGPSAVSTDLGQGSLLLQRFLSTGGDARVAADFTVNNSSVLVNVTGLTVFGLVAGNTYAFHSVLFTTSTGGQGVQAAVGGTATATSVVYEGQTVSAATILTQTRAAALGTAVGGVAATAVSRIDIFGSLTVNASGTLTIQFAQQSAGATNSTVKQGSWFKVWQIQ